MSKELNWKFKESLIQITQRVKFVKIKDLFSFFPMVLGWLLSFPFRMIHKQIWLICERKDEARDNGYWFFKYLCENHPDIEAVYAINKKAIDYRKVEKLGKVIQFGGIVHWIYYFAAKRNISSQKEGKPNAVLCFILEVYLGMQRNRAYIRHGIIKDKQRWVFYDVTKMNLFVCAAKREFDYVRNYFGYPEGNVKLLGLCRYDNLLTSGKQSKRQILIMPTMREWLRVISKETQNFEKSDTFLDSEYYKTWNSLLHNKKLHYILDNYKIHLVFYLHSSMQKYLCYFRQSNESIVIADDKNFDVQQLLVESAVLVTDYSSVFFDFAYMKKPIIYYQFDYEKYRKGQYQEGYFSYLDDGFGPVAYYENDILTEIENIIDINMNMVDIYKDRVNSFFAFHDDQNCRRTYEAVLNMVH